MSTPFAHLGLPKAPTTEELNCLRAVPKSRRDQALIEVMAGCGLRVSEACNLTLEGIHWGSDTPSLRFIGKRGKERVVPLNLQAQDALRAWLDQRPAGPFVFCHLRTGAPLSRQAVWKSLRRYAQQAGLRPVHPHMLRHAFGTNLADRQVPIERIRELMGHASIQTSQVMGGGRRWFLPQGEFGSSREASTDYHEMPEDMVKAWNLPAQAVGSLDPNRDLLRDFENAGFTYVDRHLTGPNALSDLGTPDKLLGLFAYGNMNAAMDKVAKRRAPARHGVVDDYRAPDQPMLDEMTEVALRVLNKDRDGFVLLVEGAHIDKQSHLMDADRVIDEVLEFDRAVAVARSFADRAGETLVVVLADGYPETFDLDGKLLFGFAANSDRYESWRQKQRPVIDALLPEELKRELREKRVRGRA